MTAAEMHIAVKILVDKEDSLNLEKIKEFLETYRPKKEDYQRGGAS